MVDPSRNHLRLLGQGEPTLVFGHGFGSDQSAWTSVAEAFAGSHRVLLFDHVGFGRSDRLAHCGQRHSSLDGYAQDLLDLLEDQQLHDVVYVGHSIGGVIGLLASLLQPQRFARMVLLNASPHFIDGPGYRGGFQRRQMAGLLAQMDADYPAWAAFLAPVAIGEDNPTHYIEDFGRGLHALDPLIAARFARLAFYVDCRARLAEVRHPCLVLQSTHDAFAPVEVGEYLQRQLPHARLQLLENSGHCPHITHPQLVIQALQELLAQREEAARTA
ncbi:alpha/beta hydrolase [Mitsuaria sp. WAJ17]|uniref:alpha/beta fold hydrolase n=1 Tax=Mitsuaria sp. WAJ17 TaxID=2761452 RepID=UPI00160365E0|nr:alpha/beta hydrolase [Mitsuaria sp. WAJ17]MBB2487765.1 alpha/beta hydrolase [Mitsuaria sp. WAJ17]